MRKPRVLVFDDDRFIRELFSDIFAREGLDVLAFPEPSACPVYEHGDCRSGGRCADILVADLSMPNMTGIEFLQKQAARGCRLDPRNKLVVSGSFRNGDLEAIRDLGCSFFRKPFTVAQISAWLTDARRRFDLSDPLAFIDRRGETRAPAGQPAEFFLGHHPEHSFPGQVINRSGRGLCIAVPEKLERGLSVRVISALESFRREGVVRWVRPAQPYGYLAGLYCVAGG